MSASRTTTSGTTTTVRFCDIGANLLDPRYLRGVYRGQERHPPDIEDVLQRAIDNNVERIILTAGTIEESRTALQTARAWNKRYADRNLRFGCTVGVHPTRCRQIFVENKAVNDETQFNELLNIVQDGVSDHTVVAYGECGLDYERLEFCDKATQIHYFKKQLEIAQQTSLPLFLHNRNTGTDLLEILQDYQFRGVVHSFDDTLALAEQFMDLGYYIGLNGCSLRTEDSLHVVSKLPLNQILLETDCPYCEVRKSHPGYPYIQTHFPAKAEKKFAQGHLVKSRQEPCHIVQIAEIVASLLETTVKEVASATFQNSLNLFGSLFLKDEKKQTLG